MPTSKREQAHTERRLVTALTQACETAKSELPGFCWLTHEVDYAAFPASLQAVWVFDTLANKHAALACAMDERMIELTREAFDEAQVSVANVSAHVHVDSEQECLHENGGDWQQRIRRKYSKRG
ncbi:hypothetical protein ACKUFS_11000 [Pseudomonas cannabina]|uniref:Fis family transcriptional regulator n=3 Tax=Pseudomonas syringae group TaxID=136849 RepID=A0A3M3RI58_PSECA|nr:MULTISPECIES: hypothetical protein [Pseudomonas syringae group]KPB72347.1 Uncharacterized protein AC507_0299 [Pseudomonas syringae pv. maculicola]MBM0140306.1 hypothetical protein [Pseudomonas cannabina pv. alisalensis]QHE96932.1 hypothetical protein PMA4326_010045 [Pseudomonas syringae pv. maculicola str. ES4326]QQN20019.1 hypothetical protein JGS08_15375 [Pseudomonas cannabina pv. alisalensis]RMN82150.1 hypothetical protein ALQ53_01573 [Pseudomonas cannabina]